MSDGGKAPPPDRKSEFAKKIELLENLPFKTVKQQPNVAPPRNNLKDLADSIRQLKSAFEFRFGTSSKKDEFPTELSELPGFLKTEIDSMASILQAQTLGDHSIINISNSCNSITSETRSLISNLEHQKSAEFNLFQLISPEESPEILVEEQKIVKEEDESAQVGSAPTAQSLISSLEAANRRISAANDELKKKEKRIEFLERSLRAHKREFEGVQSKLSEMDEKQKISSNTAKSLHEKCSLFERQIQSLRSEKVTLVAEKEESDKMIKELKEKVEAGALPNAKLAAEMTHKETQFEHESVQEMETNINDLMKKNSDILDEISKLKSEKSSVEERLSKQIGSFSAESIAKNNEIAELRRKLESNGNDSDRLTNEFVQAKKELGNKMDEIMSLKETISSMGSKLRETKNAAESQRLEMGKQLSEAKERLEAAELDRSRQSQSISDLQKDLRDEKLLYKANDGELRKKIEELQQNLSQTRHDNTHYRVPRGTSAFVTVIKAVPFTSNNFL